jgi:hypothetical protein
MSMQTTARPPSLRQLAGALPIGLFRALADANRLAVLSEAVSHRERRIRAAKSALVI